jgi:hypothetical protein
MGRIDGDGSMDEALQQRLFVVAVVVITDCFISICFGRLLDKDKISGGTTSTSIWMMTMMALLLYHQCAERHSFTSTEGIQRFLQIPKIR